MLKAKFAQMTVEEVANTLTHGFGLVLSLAGFVVLLFMSLFKDDVWLIASALLYGLSLVILYAASTFYHGAVSEKFKGRMQIVDHCCIYILIAGSYTPFALIVLRDTFGENLFIGVWSFAFIGILLKLIFGSRFPFVSVISYLAMGWLAVFAVLPLYAALGLMPTLMIVAGGLSYTVGVIFFAWERLPHNHAIWHIFVLIGSILHFLTVAIYVIPYTASQI